MGTSRRLVRESTSQAFQSNADACLKLECSATIEKQKSCQGQHSRSFVPRNPARNRIARVRANRNAGPALRIGFREMQKTKRVPSQAAKMSGFPTVSSRSSSIHSSRRPQEMIVNFSERPHAHPRAREALADPVSDSLRCTSLRLARM